MKKNAKVICSCFVAGIFIMIALGCMSQEPLYGGYGYGGYGYGGYNSYSTSTSYSNGSSTSSQYQASETTPTKKKCGFCGGKGSTIEYTANFGIDTRPWCDKCGKHVTSGHYHKTCTHCKGTGVY